MPLCQSNPDRRDSITNWMSRLCPATDGIAPMGIPESEHQIWIWQSAHQDTPLAAASTQTSSSNIKILAHVQTVRERSGFVVMSIDEEAGIGRIWRLGRSRKSKTVFRTLLPPNLHAARCSFPIATSFGASVDIRQPAPAGSA